MQQPASTDTSAISAGLEPAPADADAQAELHVSTLELFFDLVFVFTITRVTHLVAPAGWKLGLWLVAVLAIVGSTIARLEEGFLVNAGHFAERHGLVILIALGESVVDIGAGVTDVRVAPSIAIAAVLGLALVATLWWSYFDRDDTSAEHALAQIDPRARARIGILAYWYAHLAMIAGIIAAAAGMQGALADVAQVAGHSAAFAWLLAAGVALYLVGAAAFRQLVHIGPARARFVAIIPALATAPLGLVAGSLTQLATLVALLVTMLVAERSLAERRLEELAS